MHLEIARDKPCTCAPTVQIVMSECRPTILFSKEPKAREYYATTFPEQHLSSSIEVMPNTKGFGDLYNLYKQLSGRIKGNKAVLCCL